MCDTLVATPSATRDGVTIFAKNSDREPNEAQHIVFVAARDHGPGDAVSCTYIDIPQVLHTHAVVLSKPFWIWGAEMGANEHGVAIGNEAVFSKIPGSRQNALIGMDLLRLGLERAQTARTALDVIIELLEKHGQGGNCGFKHKTYYHNSFIIADPREAWLLETVDRHWTAKRIEGVYAISNGLSLGKDSDDCSKNLISEAVSKKWCKTKDDFHFARNYSDVVYTRFSDSRRRRSRVMALMEKAGNAVDLPFVMSVLRDHGDSSSDWRPDRGITGCNVCMHAGFGPVRISQTTGSMVSRLHPDRAVHFFTATAAPCTGIFKPVWIDVPIPDTGPEPGGEYDGGSLFWRHEKLHRAVLSDYRHRLSSYQRDRDALEEEFIKNTLAHAFDAPEQREIFSRKCFESAKALENTAFHRIQDAPVQKHPGRLYAAAWKKFNHQAKLPDHHTG